MVELQFHEDFADRKEERRSWLKRKLWLQRQCIQKRPKPQYAGWEAQFEAWELGPAMKAKTLYVVRNLRRMQPLPITSLVKLSNNEPIAPNFKYSYSVCEFPSGIKEIPRSL